jgi:filamentous hemagglutinin family protein
VLPGTSWLLPPSLGKKVAGVLAQGRGSKAGALTGTKGTTTVAPGVNAFVSPAITPGAGVTSDGSLGTGPVNYSGGEYTIPASVGTQVGGNLFESFSKFNLLQGEVADFQGPSNVQNILARVTGGSASSIDGTIQSDIQGANLFLINPAGVMFGPNARLAVGGSFVATTADYVMLADGGQFNATPGSDNLTAAPVTEFGFLAAQPNAVTVNGSTLAVPDGQTLAFLAGGFQMTGGSLLAPDGSIRIAAAGGQTEVYSDYPPQTFTDPEVPGTSLFIEPLNFPQTSPLRGPVQISGATFDADGSGSGIDILSDALTLTNTILSAKSTTLLPQDTTGPLPPYISIRAAGAVLLDNSQVIVDAIGDTFTGEINISSYSSITLQNGSALSASSPLGQLGGAGTIELQAPLIVLTGAGTGIFLDGGADASSGPSGLLNIGTGFALDGINLIPTELLSVRDGARISCVASLGLPIASVIDSDHIVVSGAGSEIDFNSVVDVSDSDDFPISSAGLLDIQANGSLIVSAGGKILAETLNLAKTSAIGNAGPGGGIQIIAGNVVATGHGSEISVSTDDQVNGGTLGIFATGNVTISDGAEVAASTTSYGNGGDVTISARSIDILGNGSEFTGIDSSTDGSNAPHFGNGGSITLDARVGLTLSNGASVIATTEGAGAGGRIIISSPVVTLDGASKIDTSSLGPNPVQYFNPIAPDVSVQLNINDPVDADLSAYLTDPAGTVVELFGSGDATGENFVNTTFSDNFSDNALQFLSSGAAPYSGTYFPLTSLLYAEGDPLNGNWTLEVQNAGSSVGTFVNWTLLAGKQHFTATDLPQTIAAMGSVTSILNLSAIPLIPVHEPGGNAGSITVHGNVLNIMNGSSLISNTQNSGRGGTISIKVAELNLSSGAGITASTSGLGNGGDISIKSVGVNLGAGTSLSAESSGEGESGEVMLDTGALQFDPGSSITSANTGTGDAGKVSIAATGDVTLDDGSAISVSAAQGDAGQVTITAGNQIILNGGSSITASAGKNGGNIRLTASGFVNLFDAAITATAGTSHRGGSEAGNGGNITIDPEYIVLDDSLISANAAAGQGGNIVLESSYYLNSDSSITATGATSGTVTITSPELDLSGALVGLPASPVGAETQLQETCAMAVNGDFSSFLAVGQGDVEAGPDEAQGGTGDAGEDRREQGGPRKVAHRSVSGL